MSQRISLLKRIVLPGIILQSVLIGGGFATGREIVEYGGKFGAMGWISGLSIFLGFTIMSVISFEACRQWKVYDYKSLLKKMIGRGWIAYELIYIPLAILIIAVMASAAGEILKNTLGLNVWIGIMLIIVLVGLLNYMGENFIARMKTIGTIALFAAYTLFGVGVYLSRKNEVLTVFQEGDTSFVDPPPTLFLLIWTGVIYVGYNLAVYPATFFTLRTLKSRKESIVAGIFSGLLMTIPWFLTYLAILAYYPDPALLNAPVPWLVMLKPFNRVFIIIFGVVVGWTLVETATGAIHAFIGRLQNDLIENHKPGLDGKRRALISFLALGAAILLARVGIIDLIAKGYSFMAYGMIMVFAIPLLYYAIKLFFHK